MRFRSRDIQIVEILSINNYSANEAISSKGKLKIPNHNYLRQNEKFEYIQALQLAQVFENLQKSFSNTIKTFIRTIK